MDERKLLENIEWTALNQQLHCLKRAKLYKPSQAYADEMNALIVRMSCMRAQGLETAEIIRQTLVREGIVAPGHGRPTIGDTYLEAIHVSAK
jgi:hypothetical protein